MEKDFYLEKWSGEFGDKYTERCDVDPDSRTEIFKSIFDDVQVSNALEVGCNKGHNITALERINIPAVGIEPNRSLCTYEKIVNGSAYDIPWDNNVFDVTFTSGVLIHIPNEKLERAMSEMRRVSSSYVLMIEYYAEQEKGREYRDFGNKEGVWARPYGDIYQELFKNDRLVKSGKIKDLGDDGWGFSDCDYWLFEKG